MPTCWLIRNWRGWNNCVRPRRRCWCVPRKCRRRQFAVWYHPLHAVGGDFYDVTRYGNESYGYLLADISGHNIDVGFFTSALKALFRQNCTPLHSPLEMMHVLNDVLLAILHPEQFITACYVLLNRHRQLMKVVSAGHPPLVWVHPGQSARWLAGGGDVLGTFTDPVFYVEEHEVKCGDRLLLYSDGLLDVAVPPHLSYPDGKAMLTGASEHMILRPVTCMVRELSLLFLPAAEAATRTIKSYWLSRCNAMVQKLAGAAEHGLQADIDRFLRKHRSGLRQGDGALSRSDDEKRPVYRATVAVRSVDQCGAPRVRG